MSDVISSPPPEQAVLEGQRLSQLWWRWVSRVTSIVGGREPLRVNSYTVATLPDASKWSGCLVIVTDETDGRTLATSDGVIWRRVSDGEEVS